MTTKRKYYRCCCCGASFYDARPQDPERDIGYGTCESCKPLLARDATKCGFAGKEYNYDEALVRFNSYA